MLRKEDNVTPKIIIFCLRNEFRQLLDVSRYAFLDWKCNMIADCDTHFYIRLVCHTFWWVLLCNLMADSINTKTITVMLHLRWFELCLWSLSNYIFSHHSMIAYGTWFVNYIIRYSCCWKVSYVEAIRAKIGFSNKRLHTHTWLSIAWACMCFWWHGSIFESGCHVRPRTDKVPSLVVAQTKTLSSLDSC